MKQPIKKNIQKKKVEAKKNNKPHHLPRNNIKSKNGEFKYGTSKLEKDFAREFLDRYGIQYIYEYEAKDIGRFYDFAIVTKKSKYITEDKEGLTSIIQGIQHTPIDFLIEIDGGYWHSDPRLFEGNELNPIQKRNKKIDGIKDKWASMHGIPLLRVWEYDIRHNPQKVLDELRKYVHIPKDEPKKRKRIMKLK